MNKGVIRSFVAIELPEQTRQALATLQSQLKNEIPPQTVRWTRPASIHLTLQFLGDVPVDQIGSITDALGGVCAGQSPFAFTLEGVGVFPNPRRPRIVWAGITEPTGALAALHREIGRSLAPLGYPPENRSFKPHLTIGRAQRQAASHDLTRLGDKISQSKIGELGQVSVVDVKLMQSDLKPTGAVYRAQAVMPLMPRQD